jgi:cytoskeletal protein RodZ
MANPFMMDDPFEVQGGAPQARPSVVAHVAVGDNVSSPTAAMAVQGQGGMTDVSFQGGYQYPAAAAVNIAGAAMNVAAQAVPYGAYAATAPPTEVYQQQYQAQSYGGQPAVSVAVTATAPSPDDTPAVISSSFTSDSGVLSPTGAGSPPILDEIAPPTLDERKEIKAAAAAVLATVGDFPDLAAAISRPETKDIKDKGRFIIMVGNTTAPLFSYN